MEIREVGRGDAAGLLALNNRHALELAEESAEGFAELLRVAWRVRVADPAGTGSNGATPHADGPTGSGGASTGSGGTSPSDGSIGTSLSSAGLTGSAGVSPSAAGPVGMCVAFDQDTDRDSQNINWFRERFERFAYIDRVVVDPAARGRGLARRFYTDVIEAARAQGHTRLCAEINLNPPNPASDAFHAAMGFTPIGQAKLDGRDKTVQYFVKDLT